MSSSPMPHGWSSWEFGVAWSQIELSEGSQSILLSALGAQKDNVTLSWLRSFPYFHSQWMIFFHDNLEVCICRDSGQSKGLTFASQGGNGDMWVHGFLQVLKLQKGTMNPEAGRLWRWNWKKLEMPQPLVETPKFLPHCRTYYDFSGLTACCNRSFYWSVLENVEWMRVDALCCIADVE